MSQDKPTVSPLPRVSVDTIRSVGLALQQDWDNSFTHTINDIGQHNDELLTVIMRTLQNPDFLKDIPPNEAHAYGLVMMWDLLNQQALSNVLSEMDGE